MKPSLRLQMLLALACLGFILALLTVQAGSANLCTVTAPAPGGYLTEGLLGRPTALNPLLADANPIDRELSQLIFDGLTAYDDTGHLAPALARSWDVSDDGLTVVFTLGENTWHDGEPVTADDVAFTYGLMQDETFPGPPGLAELWRTVKIAVVDPSRVAFTLPAPYAPFLDATTRGILPAHLLRDVTAAELPELEFNRQPVGTGPFQVESAGWVRTGRLRLAPNPNYWRGGLNLQGLELRFYPSVEELVQAYRRGDIYGLHLVPPEALPGLTEFPDVRLFSWPAPRFTELLYNLGPAGHPALANLDVRTALARGLNRSVLIDRALDGQGVTLDGPFLPSSWAYRPDLQTVRAYDPAAANELLEGAGWPLPVGAAVRASAGTELALRLLYADEPVDAATAAEVERQWGALGVAVRLEAVSADELPSRLAEGAFDAALLEIVPLGDPDLYDFWSQEAIIRGQNYGGWNNRRASEALEEARQTWSIDERLGWYERFQRLYDQALPAFTLYQAVNTYALSEVVQSLSPAAQAEIGLVRRPIDRYRTLPDWFLFYRDVLVACPDNASDG